MSDVRIVRVLWVICGTLIVIGCVWVRCWRCLERIAVALEPKRSTLTVDGREMSR